MTRKTATSTCQLILIAVFSFVGLSGGEIFHEMMLRQGVKHICQWHATQAYSAVADINSSWLSRRRHSARL
jgi:hypothetical protein